jgi:hypothetical protein
MLGQRHALPIKQQRGGVQPIMDIEAQEKRIDLTPGGVQYRLLSVGGNFEARASKPLDFRFTSFATEIVRRRNMSRWAISRHLVSIEELVGTHHQRRRDIDT